MNQTRSPRPKRATRLAIRSVTTLGAVTALTLAATATAHANVTVSHGSDRAEANAYCMRAYDGEHDGNGVYADAYLENKQHVSNWDGNGADGQWGPSICYSSPIAQFRVCEDHLQCPEEWSYDPA